MHKLFGEWYRVAGIEPRGEDLPKRWVGVEAASKDLDIAKSLDVVRIFLGMNASLESKDRLAVIFQKSDSGLSNARK